jgi:hypothetical protein
VDEQSRASCTRVRPSLPLYLVPLSLAAGCVFLGWKPLPLSVGGARCCIIEPHPHGHYMRKPHTRCTSTKNRDVQIMCLRHCISYYRVIQDTHPDAYPIRIHLRCVLISMCLPLEDASETRFNDARHQFDCSLWH